MNEITTIDVLKIIGDMAHRMREDGESDIRDIISVVNFLKREILSGKSKEEILFHFVDEEE